MVSAERALVLVGVVRPRVAADVDLTVLDVDVSGAAVRELPEQDLVRERRLQGRLDEARHRSRTHRLVVAVLDKPVDRRRADLELDLLLAELALELVEE